MVNSISTSFIKGLCDEMGINTYLDSFGNIVMPIQEIPGFKHTAFIFITVKDNNYLQVRVTADYRIAQEDVAKTMIKMNEYNRRKKFMKAYLDDEGLLCAERDELIDEYVSEEYIKVNCLKFVFALGLDFLKDNFSGC